MHILRLLPFLLLFTGFSLAQTAEDLNISQSEMIEIENRISSLSANELNARKVFLMMRLQALKLSKKKHKILQEIKKLLDH